jgi:BASS family bile acid:Na+ symporter
MKKKSVYNLFYLASAAFLIAWIVVTLQEMHSIAGWFLMLFFLCLAIGVRGSRLFKGLSFTVIIFATVSLAMYYPGYFQKWGGLDLGKLIIPLIQLIMFGMGTEMSL